MINYGTPLAALMSDLHHPCHLEENKALPRQRSNRRTAKDPPESGLVKDVLKSGRQKAFWHDWSCGKKSNCELVSVISFPSSSSSLSFPQALQAVKSSRRLMACTIITMQSVGTHRAHPCVENTALIYIQRLRSTLKMANRNYEIATYQNNKEETVSMSHTVCSMVVFHLLNNPQRLNVLVLTLKVC